MNGYVITHPEMGVYLGNCLGLGFWSMLDCVGQLNAPVFPTEAEAAKHIASWAENNTVAEYTMAPVQCDETEYASITNLKEAGLEHLITAMGADFLEMSPSVGMG